MCTRCLLVEALLLDAHWLSYSQLIGRLEERNQRASDREFKNLASQTSPIPARNVCAHENSDSAPILEDFAVKFGNIVVQYLFHNITKFHENRMIRDYFIACFRKQYTKSVFRAEAISRTFGQIIGKKSRIPLNQSSDPLDAVHS